MKWILKAWHWQVFSGIFIIPIILIVLGLVLAQVTFNPGYIFLFVPIAMSFGQAVVYIWIWATGSALIKRDRSNIVKNKTLFRFFALLPAFILVSTLLFWLYGAVVYIMGTLSIAEILYTSLFLVFALQFLVIVSILFCFNFIARLLNVVEEKRDVSFDKYFSDFVLAVIFPVGIWYLQPRINKLTWSSV